MINEYIFHAVFFCLERPDIEKIIRRYGNKNVFLYLSGGCCLDEVLSPEFLSHSVSLEDKGVVQEKDQEANDKSRG